MNPLADVAILLLVTAIVTAQIYVGLWLRELLIAVKSIERLLRIKEVYNGRE